MTEPKTESPKGEAIVFARRVERFLETGRHISLHAEIITRAQTLFAAVFDEEGFTAATASAFTPEIATQRAAHYEALTEPLLAAVATGCYWSESNRAATFTDCAGFLATAPQILSAHFYEQEATLFQLYPALLLAYGAGIAAVAAQRYETLATLLMAPIPNSVFKKGPFGLASALTMAFPLTEQIAKALLTRSGEQHVGESYILRSIGFPSKYLLRYMRPFFHRTLLRDEQYTQAFAEFEFWLDHVGVDDRDRINIGRSWYRADASYSSTFGRLGRYLVQELDAEAEKAKNAWPPLQAGLFAGSYERYQAVRQLVR